MSAFENKELQFWSGGITPACNWVPGGTHRARPCSCSLTLPHETLVGMWGGSHETCLIVSLLNTVTSLGLFLSCTCIELLICLFNYPNRLCTSCAELDQCLEHWNT